MRPFITALFAASFITPALAQEPSRNLPATGFDRVELGGCDHVVVTIGPRFDVTATGASASLAAIRFAVRGDTLRLSRAEGTCDTRARRPSARITVTMPRLSALAMTGVGNMRLPAMTTPRFSADLSGTGNLDVAGLRAADTRIYLSGTGNVALGAVQVERLSLDLGGTGRITATGRAGALAIDAGGTGDVDTRGLVARDVVVDAGGTGSVRAQATGTARIDASGMGRVAVTGTPRCTVRKSGFARVACG